MSVPARLKWCKEKDRYSAYPVGRLVENRYAAVYFEGGGFNTDLTPYRRVERWRWHVLWEGWFVSQGWCDSKQSAADRATAEWWASVQTELPRNVELEVAIIVARAMVSPMPNSLLSENVEFLQKVMWHLNDLHREEVKHDKAPAPVRELMGRISEELYRRRVTIDKP